MLDSVFDRLFNYSVKDNVEKKERVKVIRQSEDKNEWELRLAAGCYLVDNETTPRQSYVSLKSLSSSTLHRKRSKKRNIINENINSCNVSARQPEEILSARRRIVSHIMDKEGNITVNSNYVITDSVEPPPYHYLKPKSAMNTRFYEKRDAAYFKGPEVEELKKEVSRSKKMKNTVDWGEVDEVVVKSMNIEEDHSKRVNNPKNFIIVDANAEFDASKEQNITNMISLTGKSWDNSGYPNSLSFILPKPKFISSL